MVAKDCLWTVLPGVLFSARGRVSVLFTNSRDRNSGHGGISPSLGRTVFANRVSFLLIVFANNSLPLNVLDLVF